MARSYIDKIIEPIPAQQKLVDKLNERLRQDLGLRCGVPRYKWMYSDSVLHPVRETIGDDHQLVYDYRCHCGLNRSKHAPHCNGAIALEPRYHFRLLIRGWKNRDGSQVHRQWVLWAHVPPPTEQDWRETFGTQLDYSTYAAGSYEPFTIGPSIAAIRQKDVAPDLTTTQTLIGMIIRYKAVTESQVEEEYRRAKQADREARREIISQEVKDMFPMGNIPGRKDCGVSFRPRATLARGEQSISQAISQATQSN